MSCGALAPQANGDGDMRVGNRREVDSERQRQQFVAPPGVADTLVVVRKSEMKLPRANAALQVRARGAFLSAAFWLRSKKSVI